MQNLILKHVEKALMYQTVNDILNINQITYRQNLYNYFERLFNEKTEIDFNNSDLRHDIHGLKNNSDYFVPRL